MGIFWNRFENVCPTPFWHPRWLPTVLWAPWKSTIEIVGIFKRSWDRSFRSFSIYLFQQRAEISPIVISGIPQGTLPGLLLRFHPIFTQAFLLRFLQEFQAPSVLPWKLLPRFSQEFFFLRFLNLEFLQKLLQEFLERFWDSSRSSRIPPGTRSKIPTEMCSLILLLLF